MIYHGGVGPIRPLAGASDSGVFKIWRPSTTLAGVKHFGVLDTGRWLALPGPAGFHAIVDLVAKGPQVQWVTDLGPWQVVGRARDPQGAAQRLRDVLANPVYDALANNCEHLSSYIIDGRRESPQLQSAVVWTLLICGAWWLVRRPGRA
jgi:hypothetical protein